MESVISDLSSVIYTMYIYVQMNTTFMSDARRVSVCARVQPVSLRLAHLYIVIMLILNYYLPPSERKCDLKSYI